MQHDRLSEWVRDSYGTARLEHFLPVTIQMLGRLDCHLIEGDARLAESPAAPRTEIPDVLRLNDQLTLSYLWILGAYEVVRTIHQRTAQIADLTKEMSDEIAATKRRFARLRMPLAKMEPAHAHKSTDGSIAYPASHPSLGTAWQVAPETFISRRELSDSLLAVLAQLRSVDPDLPQGETG